MVAVALETLHLITKLLKLSRARTLKPRRV